MSCPAKQPSLPRKANGGQFKKTLALTTMVLPGAVWYLLLRYLPMGGIVMSLYYRVVVIRAPSPRAVLQCKGCCGLVLTSYRKTVPERLQPQPFTVLLIS